jgi:bla regulator protein blaR1
MTPIAHAVTSALLHFLWQGLLVAVFLWIALGWMRKSSAQARYLAACAALALAAVLPLITAMVILRNAPAAASSAGAILTLPAIAAAGTGSQSANWLALIQKWALPVWSCGVLIFSLRLTWGCRQISVLKRRGTPADDALLFTVERLAERMGLRRALFLPSPKDPA